jgi:hypothetical protein
LLFARRSFVRVASGFFPSRTDAIEGLKSPDRLKQILVIRRIGTILVISANIMISRLIGMSSQQKVPICSAIGNSNPDY